MNKLLRYGDLKDLGIIKNRVTLRRWMATEGFPIAVQLGLNSVAWREDEIEAWVASRQRISTAKSFPQPRLVKSAKRD